MNRTDLHDFFTLIHQEAEPTSMGRLKTVDLFPGYVQLYPFPEFYKSHGSENNLHHQLSTANYLIYLGSVYSIPALRFEV